MIPAPDSPSPQINSDTFTLICAPALAVNTLLNSALVEAFGSHVPLASVAGLLIGSTCGPRM